MLYRSGFGGLEVACWPLVPKFAGSHPAEAVGFLGRTNPQHAFLRSSTFRRWVLSRGDTGGDAWWRKLERLTQTAQ